MNSHLCIIKPCCETEAVVKKKAISKDIWRSGDRVSQKYPVCCITALKQIRILDLRLLQPNKIAWFETWSVADNGKSPKVLGGELSPCACSVPGLSLRWSKISMPVSAKDISGYKQMEVSCHCDLQLFTYLETGKSPTHHPTSVK